MLPSEFESRINRDYQNLIHAVNRFYDYPRDTDIRLYEAAEALYPIVNNFFHLFQLIYRIGYGNNYTMPMIFTENHPGFGFPQLAKFMNFSQAPLNDCGNGSLAKIVEQFLLHYFQYFQSSSFQDFFNCTRSISITACAKILGEQAQNIPSLKDMLEDKE
jgi:hypothetical protein